MRTFLACAVVSTMLTACAAAQQTAPATKLAVTDEAVVEMVGGRMAKMFARFGTPQDAWAQRGETEDEDEVFFDYGGFAMKVREKTVRVCFFFKGWQGPVRGISIGDSREDVVKALGEPTTTVKDKNGVVTAYGYDLNDLDANFFANFHEDGKVWRVEVSLK